jgi:hypothetical protein
MSRASTPRLPNELSPEQLAKVVALAWRPAWSIRSRAGCLAPLFAWWASRRAGQARLRDASASERSERRPAT